MPLIDLKAGPFCEVIPLPFPSSAPISRLRLTRQDPFGTVRRVAICGTDAECPDVIVVNNNSNNFTDEIDGNPITVKIEDLKPNSTSLKWERMPMVPGNYDTPFAEEFDLKLGQQLDANGEVVTEMQQTIKVQDNELEVIHHLSGLAPATTYFGTITVKEYPCYIIRKEERELKFQFTTPTKNLQVGHRSADSNSEIHQSVEPYKLFITPNPVKTEANIFIDNGLLKTVTIMNNAGQVLKRKNNILQSKVLLNLENLPIGVYWIKTMREDGLTKTGLMMKQ